MGDSIEVIYIMSLVRSGSTFLEFLLSSHPQVVAIGEVGLVLREYTKIGGPRKASEKCTCGAQPESCPFWGPLLKQLPSLSPQEGFRQILIQFIEMFPHKILVDSSKSLEFVEKFYLPYLSLGRKPHIYLKILFLVRDFRGWTVSYRKHLLRANKSNILNSNIVLNSYRWMYINLKRLHKLKKYGLQFLPVYYEHLIFNTEDQLRRICDFLEIDYRPDAFSLSKAKVHELYGSTTMKDPYRASRIYYDTSWMQNLKFILYGPLLLPVAIFNSFYAKKTMSQNVQNLGTNQPKGA